MLEEKSDNINDDLSMAKQKLNEAKKLDQNLDIEEDKQEIAQALNNLSFPSQSIS